MIDESPIEVLQARFLHVRQLPPQTKVIFSNGPADLLGMKILKL